MSYRIMARSTHATAGVAKRTAAEALEAVRELSGDGFELTAVIDDDGDAVPVQRLEELAAIEAAPSR